MGRQFSQQSAHCSSGPRDSAPYVVLYVSTYEYVRVPETRSGALSASSPEDASGHDDPSMTLRLLYLMFCQPMEWLTLLPRSSAAKDASC